MIHYVAVVKWKKATSVSSDCHKNQHRLAGLNDGNLFSHSVGG